MRLDSAGNKNVTNGGESMESTAENKSAESRDDVTSTLSHHLVLNQNVAMWSFCAFAIFVANLRVPVNRSEGSTKTRKFATKITNLRQV